MRQITEAIDVAASPDAVFHIFSAPDRFVECRPGITRFAQLTGAKWEEGAEFEVRGTFGSERYRARGRVTLLKGPCNFAFSIPAGLGPLKDYRETYRMTFAGSSFTLIVNGQYDLPKGLTVGMMDRFVFHRRMQGELREVLVNIAERGAYYATHRKGPRAAAASDHPEGGAPPPRGD